MARVAKSEASHIVARVSGVDVGDSRIAAAEKVIATMKLAGMCTRQAERMLADAKARGVR